MVAICVDDEYLLLEILKSSVAASPDITEVVAFSDGKSTLEWAKNNHFDIAFLDIEMSDMNGIELSKHLREIVPYVPIFFCTAHSDYSMDAIRAHANGYIMKSITPEKIQKEINYLLGENQSEAPIQVKCDGGFFAYDRQGEPLSFSRKRALEVFAILVYKQGESVSVVDLCDMLWPESDGGANEANKNYLYKYLSALKKTFKEADAKNLIISDDIGYRVDMSLIQDISSSKENYMGGYAWAK